MEPVENPVWILILVYLSALMFREYLTHPFQ
jgi:hypothetical protein